MSKNGCIKSIHNPMIDYQIPLVFALDLYIFVWNVSLYFGNDTNVKHFVTVFTDILGNVHSANIYQ